MVARNDNIAAIATAPGRGGVAVIRVSGPDAFVVAERLTNKKPQVGRVQFVSFRGTDDRRQAPADPGGPLILDEGLLLSFKAPHSYTGEDVVEFQCHGGTVTPQRILAACLAAGARLARHGEFTERAFLNGKLALDQAESVLDLIDAKTERAADVALKGLTGQRDREAQTLYEQAIDISSEVEHALDIDEGELPESFLTSLAARVEELKDSLRSALVRAREGKILREGALVVLAGPPNAGKSSLMNALLGEHRAIVSEVAGTTRDSIEEWLDLDGWPVRLVDTAGLRETADAIEAEGVRRSERLIEKAAVVVELGSADAVRQPAADRREATITVVSKCDLLSASARRDATDSQRLFVSAKTGEGLDALKQAIVDKLVKRAEAFDEEQSMESRAAAYHEALSLLTSDAPAADLVLLGNALHRACEILGAEFGAVYSEDLLDRLFSRFCVGK